MPYLREFSKKTLCCTLTTTKDGKKIIKIHPSKTQRSQIRGQLGDDYMAEPVIPLKEPGSHDGMAWHSQEEVPVKAPSVFVRIPCEETAEFFKAVDAILPDEMERLGLGNEYKRDDYRPLVNVKDGQTAVSVKMNVQGSEKQKPVAIHVIEEDAEDPRDGDVLEIKPGQVSAMYMDVALASIWKVKRDWGTTIWANEVYLRPTQQEAMVIGGMTAKGGKFTQRKEEDSAPPSSLPHKEEETTGSNDDSNDAGSVASGSAHGSDGEGGDDGGDDDGGEAPSPEPSDESESEPTPEPEPKKEKKRHSSSRRKSSKRRQTEDE